MSKWRNTPGPNGLPFGSTCYQSGVEYECVFCHTKFRARRYWTGPIPGPMDRYCSFWSRQAARYGLLDYAYRILNTPFPPWMSGRMVKMMETVGLARMQAKMTEREAQDG